MVVSNFSRVVSCPQPKVNVGFSAPKKNNPSIHVTEQ
jgi:hypothetical protein